MNDEQRRNHERLIRVRNHMQSLAEPFPADSRGGQALAAIIAAIARAEELDAAQFTHQREAQQGTSQRREARERLREQSSIIINTARAIGQDHPEIRDKFRPSPTRNDQDLLSTGRSILASAILFKPLFLEYGMPADFLETFEANINSLERAINQQDTNTGGRIQARSGIDVVHKQAASHVKTLDTIMRNKYRDDRAALVAWESASRVERAPRSGTKGNPQPDNPPAVP